MIKNKKITAVSHFLVDTFYVLFLVLMMILAGAGGMLFSQSVVGETKVPGEGM